MSKYQVPAEMAGYFNYQGLRFYVVDIKHEFGGTATLTAVTEPRPSHADMVRITNTLADEVSQLFKGEDDSPFTDALKKRSRESRA